MSGPRRPAVVVSGPPGVGKTTTGRALAAVLPAACLDLDTMTNPLVEILAEEYGVTGDHADPTLATRVRRPRYEALTATAVDCLEVGCAVVLVAPFTAEREEPRLWEQLADRLHSAGGHPLLVWLALSHRMRLTRLRERAAPRDQVFLRREEATPVGRGLGAPRVPHLVVDASLPVAEQLPPLLEALRTTLRGTS